MTKTISIIGIPMDFGQELRGVDMGPAAVRYTGLVSRLRALDHEVVDTGDIHIPIRDNDVEITQNKTNQGEDIYLKEISHICTAIHVAGQAVVKAGRYPLLIGGDLTLSALGKSIL